MGTNILAGWKCPECGNTEDFRVEVSGMARVGDDGYDLNDVEWTADSYAECVDCGEDGIVESFTQAGAA